MSEQVCPECSHKLVHEVRPLTISYRGLSSTFDMPGWYCPNCGEGVLSGKDSAIYDRQLNRLKAQADGLLLPDEIRKIRKKLQLTQAEASAELGGGPNAFHRYENGIGLPSQAISNLLRLLDANPSGLNILRRRNTQPDNQAQSFHQ